MKTKTGRNSRRNDCDGLDMKLNHLLLHGCKIFGIDNNRKENDASSWFKQDHLLFVQNRVDLPAGKGSALSLMFCKRLSLT